MSANQKRLIPQRLQDRYMRLIAPLVRLFTRWGVSPNSLTAAGVLAIGIFPGSLYNLAMNAVKIFPGL